MAEGTPRRVVVFIIPFYPLKLDNYTFSCITAMRGEWPEFRTSRIVGANNAEGIGTFV